MDRPIPDDWIEGDGYRKQVLAPSELLVDDDALVQVVEIPPDSEVKPHYHEETEEIFFILQEGGTLVINEAAVTPERGETIICEPGDTHAVINDSDQTFRILVVKLNNTEDDTVWEDEG